MRRIPENARSAVFGGVLRVIHDFFEGGDAAFDLFPAALLQRAHAFANRLFAYFARRSFFDDEVMDLFRNGQNFEKDP